MAQSRTRNRNTAPLSRHPAFVPLVTLWWAALLGGSVAVMPAGQAIGLVSRTGFTLPRSAFPQELVIAVTAALVGGVFGFGVARGIAAIQSRGQSPASNAPEQAESPALHSMPEAEVEPVDEMPADIAPTQADLAPDTPHETKTAFDAITFESSFEDPPPIQPPLWPQAPSRHGKAVQLLRSHDTANLAMPQLIERFAVALDDHLERARLHADTYSVRKPPADLAEGLQRLKRA